MKKNLLLMFALILSIIVTTGFVIPNLQPDPPTKKAKKEKSTTVKAYEVKERRNVSRVSFFNGQGSLNQIEIRFRGTTNVNEPENIRLTPSSGMIEVNSSFVGFKDVEYPFEGTVEYTIKPRMSQSSMQGTKSNSSTFNNANDLRCKLSFVIYEPGSWEVKIAN